MAYVNGVNNSYSSNSIYGNRNMLSGLASGMDTESMIENAVSGYKMKISQLIQKRTKVGWQQQSYQSMITKMAAFSDKYTSYASPTNLMSNKFFDDAVKLSTVGTHADKISAIGKTSSDVQILGVKQLATSATYMTQGQGVIAGGSTIQGDEINLSEPVEVSSVAGTMTLNYGSKKVSISFGRDEVFKSDRMNDLGQLLDKDGKVQMDDQGQPIMGKTAREKFVDALNEKLSKENLTIGEKTYKASEKIQVELVKENGKEQIKFSSKDNAGNNVYISGASEEQQKTLGIDLEANNKDKTNTVLDVTGKEMYKLHGTVGSNLAGKEMSFTFDGVTKQIKLPDKIETMDDLKTGLQAALDNAFGQGKISVGVQAGADDKQGKLSFKVEQEGSSLSFTGSETKRLGFENQSSTFINTQKNLGQIWGEDIWKGLTASEAKGDKNGLVTTRKDPNGNEYKVDAEGYRVKLKDGKDASSMKAEDYVRVDEKGNELYDFKVNGVRVGSFNKDTELNTVLRDVNNSQDAGVKVSFSETTGQFTFEARSSGVAGKVEFEGLAANMFGDPAQAGDDYQVGQDAILTMKVNGKVMDGIKRSDNSFKVDGMTITLKDTFGTYGTDSAAGADKMGAAEVQNAAKDAVTFQSTSDADKIVDAVKDFVKDFNEMATEIKKAYSTLPAQKGNGKNYEPLTDKDKEGMTESAIKEYEEKAKQGILFGDRDLSSLYEKLRMAVSPDGKLGADMKAIGLTTEYSNGQTTLKLDENALRAALETTPDKVRDVFTQSVADGASQNGIMQSLKAPLDMYGKVHGDKGILVNKAGSPLAVTSIYNNELQKIMDNYDKDIAKWESKMNSQIDRYSRQFAKMEQLVAQMNSQSSSLAGLMGGF